MRDNNGSRLYLALCLLSLAGPILFWVILIISGFLHPGYNPIQQSISNLALEPYGRLQTAGFIFLGLVVAAFGIALHGGFPEQKRMNIVCRLFLLMGFAEIISGVFTADYPPANSFSIHAFIHQAGASVAALAFPISAFILLPVMNSKDEWKDLTTYTLISAITMLGLEIGREVLLPAHWLDSWFGLYERVLILVSFSWILIMSARLLRVYRFRNVTASRR